MSRALKDYNSIDWDELFYYDASSPTGLRWKTDRYIGVDGCVLKAKTGEKAGSVHHQPKLNRSYATVSAENTNWFAHRVIWIMHNGRLPNDLVVDHVDGNPLNNDIKNLRAVPQKLNNRNASKRKDNTSGESGIYFTSVRSGKNSDKPLTYVTASWYEEDKKRSCKHFPVHKLGLLPAFKMAVEYRRKMITDLNNAGAGYTEIHGLKKELK